MSNKLMMWSRTEKGAVGLSVATFIEGPGRLHFTWTATPEEAAAFAADILATIEKIPPPPRVVSADDLGIAVAAE